MSNVPINAAGSASAERCQAVLTLAFAGDPACRWAWPDPQQFLEAFPHFEQAFAGRAYELGTAYYHAGYSGAALWLPPHATPDEEAVTQVIRDTVTDQVKGAMFTMLEQLEVHHPEQAHWYLPLIGVDPAHQGKGIGSALLTHALKACDEQQLPAYLEATSPRSVALYERHGFVALGCIQVADSPPIVPMLRKPQPTSTRRSKSEGGA
jgi:GNAT superfamily N-acetyltransferase